MKTRAQRLQSKLTLEFTLFFIVLAGVVYYYFYTKFSDDAHELFKSKSSIFSNYINQNSLSFVSGSFENIGRLEELAKLNDADYIVIIDQKGSLVNGVNISLAESYLYITSNFQEGFTKDNMLYRIMIPVLHEDKQVGSAYVGFKSEQVVDNLKQREFLLIIFSASLLLVGILFTFFLSSINFKPLAKIISGLDAALKADPKYKVSYKRKDELGILADQVNMLLAELEKSSIHVDVLNKQLHNVVRDKLSELSLEINQRKKAESNLKKSEEQFRLLFENAPIGMMLISPDTKVVSANKALCDTLGYEMFEIIGIPVNFLLERKRFINPEKLSKKVLMEELGGLNYEKKLFKKNGNTIDVFIKSVVLYDEQNVPEYVIMQILDISNMKRAQIDLQEALEKAEESDRLKSAFLAQMSHEIRTPLNVILASVPLLADDIGEADEDVLSILNSVKSAGKRLQRTIDMILSMSAVQSGNYKAEFESFNIANEVENLANEFRSLTEEKGLELKYQNTSEYPVIIADRYTVGQIFQNLIGNAVKYTHKGFVHISVEDISEEDLVINISDTGIGMSEEYLKNIFSPFSQEDAGQKRAYEGNGLGLALVKKYVELNRAKISVQSQKNKGSVFSIHFKKKLNLTDDTPVKKIYRFN